MLSDCPVIRRATGRDLDAIGEFVTATYGTGAPFKGRARYLWQFVDNPFRPPQEDKPTIWLALDGARVVGTIAVQDGTAWVAGTAISAGWIVDVMVHPDWRRKGLSHGIHTAVMAERQVLVTLTMAEATRRVAERAGCLTLGPTRLYLRCHRLSGSTVRRFLAYKAGFGTPSRQRLIRLFNATRLGPCAVAGLGRLVTRLRPGPSGPEPDGEIREIERFPDEIDELWSRVRSDFPALFERSARFLNWRFADCPGLSYRRFLLLRDKKIVGYVVTRVGDSAELPLGVIVDFLARPQDSRALDTLITHAIAILEPETEFLEAAASNPAFAAALGRAGFIATRTMRPTIVCTDPSLKAGLGRYLDDWSFTKADHDWDQIHPI